MLRTPDTSQGDHATLLERKGAYYDLYMTQFRGAATEEDEESAPAPVS